MKVCIIVSNFYPKISNLLVKGAVSCLKKNKISNYKIIYVPGTFEIPVTISNLIMKYDAFIVLGCIIKGKTLQFSDIDFTFQGIDANSKIQRLNYSLSQSIEPLYKIGDLVPSEIRFGKRAGRKIGSLSVPSKFS